MTHPTLDNPCHRCRAFTLVELLVAISIVIVVISVTIPAVSVMQESSISSSGVNTIAVATEAARQLATGSRAQKDPLADGGSTAGTAVLVTNTGTVRLLENIGQGSGLATGLNGFADIAGRDYITISDNVVLIGVKRNGFGTADLKFVTPPFAIRFNEQGSLIFGGVSTAGGAYNVYYDGNYDGNYDDSASGNRPDPYDLDDPTHQQWITSSGTNPFDRFEVPFERTDTVVGVMVVHRQDVPDLTGTDSGFIGSTDPAYNAILTKGVPVFFNRYTGTPISRSDQQ